MSEYRTSLGKRVLSMFMCCLFILSSFYFVTPLAANALDKILKQDSQNKNIHQYKNEYTVKLDYKCSATTNIINKVTLSLSGKTQNGYNNELNLIEKLNGKLYRLAYNDDGTHIDNKKTQYFPTKLDLSIDSGFNLPKFDKINYDLYVNNNKIMDKDIKLNKDDYVYNLDVDDVFYPYIDSGYITANVNQITPMLCEQTIPTQAVFGDQYDVKWTADIDDLKYSIVDQDGQNVNIPGVTVDKFGVVHVNAEANFSKCSQFKVKVSAINDGHIASAVTDTISINNNKNIKQANYRVNHYKQNVSNDNYQLDIEENKIGIVGKQTDATSFNYVGFTPQNIEQQNIDKNGNTVINVYYNRNIHTVTFDDNGGKGGNSYNLKYNQQICPPTVTKTGYSFDGWDSEVLTNMPNNDLNYIAKWIANTDTIYTVEHHLENLNDDGYTKVDEDTQTLTGTTDELTSAVPKEYEGFTAAEVVQENINGDGSTVVVIEYKRNNYEVIFNPQNGQESSTVKYKYGELVEIPEIQKDGYNLVGWFTKPENGKQIDFSQTYSENLNVYAQWTGKTNTLTFDAGDGTCATQNMNVKYGSKYGNLPEATRTGYDFVGWFTDDDVQIVEDNTVKITGNTTVHAKWEIKEYTATFACEGQVVGTDKFTIDNLNVTEPEVPKKEGYTGKWESYTLTASDIEIQAVYNETEYTATFMANGVVAGEYTFTIKNLSVPEPVIPSKEGYTGKWESYKLTTSDITINAVYTPIEYTVTFVADGKAVGTDTFTVEDKELNLPAVPNKVGYTGEWKDYNISACDMTVEAKYTPIVYTATFKADDVIVKSVNFTVEDDSIEEPTVPNKVGYTCAWDDYSVSASDFTIDAVYTPIMYTATFYVDGEVVGTDQFTVEDDNLNLPKIPQKDGYKSSWEPYEITAKDISVNANYQLITYYATFMADGEEVETLPFDVEHLYIDEPAVPHKQNYSGYWEDYSLSLSDIEINAIYKFNDKTVTFDANGGVCETEFYKTCNGTNFVLPNATRPYYSFVGWFTEVEGGQQITEDNVVNGDITLYAHWKEIDYSNYFDIDEAGHIMLKNEYRVIEDEDNKGTLIYGDKYDELPTCIKIPNSVEGKPVTGIQNGCFAYSSNLQKIETNRNVTYIGKSAFYDCTALKEAILNDEIEELGSYAFFNCNKLKSIVLPNSLKEINAFVFGKCSSLTSVIGIKNLTNLGMFTFYKCYSLNNVQLNSELKSLDWGVFAGCKSIDSLILPQGLEQISMYSLDGCESLKTLDIPSSVTAISAEAFSGDITVPIFYLEDVLKVGCSSLTEVNVSEENENYKSVNGILFSKNGDDLKYYPSGKNQKSYVIPNTVKTVNDHAFEYSNLENITIPDTVTSLGLYSFADCKKLKSIYVPDSVNYMGVGCFRNCINLKKEKIRLSENKDLTLLNYAIFRGCSGLDGLPNIPNNFNELIVDSFRDCDNLINITIPKNIQAISGFSFRGCDNLTSVDMLGVKVICLDAFMSCHKLTSVTISNDLEDIKSGAFNDCPNLNNVIYMGTIEQWNAVTKDDDWNAGSGIKTVTCTDGTLDI